MPTRRPATASASHGAQHPRFSRAVPGTTIIKLEQNYRSTQPILEATNRVIAQAKHRHAKNLRSHRHCGDKPALVTCTDEDAQAQFVITKVLEHREAGVPLRKQAVLFRASHHSILLEAELMRQGIPFIKRGGLKFLEAAHVKDLISFLRLAENPRDVVSGTRVLKLLPGVGPAIAKRLMVQLVNAGADFGTWRKAQVPAAAMEYWPGLVQLLRRLANAGETPVEEQVAAVRRFYVPLLEPQYDSPEPRKRDLEQVEVLSARYKNRRALLTEMALDPPSSTQDLAGPSQHQEDYLVLSTIHSAKGLEWDCVYVIHASDGNIPSARSLQNQEQLEEELRLFYVALTRAKTWLYVLFPVRYFSPSLWRSGDGHNMAQLTRFVPKALKKCFEPDAAGEPEQPLGATSHQKVSQVREGLKAMWS